MSVRVTRHFDFPTEQVFDAWLDPEKTGNFLFQTPDGVMQKIEIDARVGGRFTITERRGEKDTIHTGEYLEIDRPHRLAFTLEDNVGFQHTVVTIEIKAVDGGCELSLTHEGVAPDYKDKVHSGWASILELLYEVLNSEKKGS